MRCAKVRNEISLYPVKGYSVTLRWGLGGHGRSLHFDIDGGGRILHSSLNVFDGLNLKMVNSWTSYSAA